MAYTKEQLAQEYARAQQAIKEYGRKGRQDLVDNANRYIQTQLNPQMGQQQMPTDIDYSSNWKGGQAGNYDIGQQGMVARQPQMPPQQQIQPNPNQYKPYFQNDAIDYERQNKDYQDAMLKAQAIGARFSGDELGKLQYVDPTTGKSRLTSAGQLQQLTGLRQAGLEGARGDRDFGAKVAQQAYANRQGEKTSNAELATKLSQMYGINIQPTQDWGNMFAKTKGLTPYNVRESDKAFNEQQRQFEKRMGLDLLQMQQRQGESDRDYNLRLQDLMMKQNESQPKFDQKNAIDEVRNVWQDTLNSIVKSTQGDEPIFAYDSPQYHAAKRQQAGNIAGDIISDYNQGSYTSQQAKSLLDELARKSGVNLSEYNKQLGK